MGWILNLFAGSELLIPLWGLGMSMYGLSIIPDKCDDPDVRGGLRGLLITSIILITLTINYALCHNFCSLRTNLDSESDTIETPPIMLAIWTILNFLIMCFAISRRAWSLKMDQNS
jgi:hypothetical protein